MRYDRDGCMPPKSGTVPRGAVRNNGSFAKAEFAEYVEASESWSGETLSDEGDTTGGAVGVGAVVDWRVHGGIRGAG
jgi:hypothetical protein